MNYRVNLLPLELQPAPPLGPKRAACITLTVLVAGGLCVACIFWWLNLYRMRAELASLQQQVPGLKETAGLVENLDIQRQKLEAEAGELERLAGERRTWSKILLDLNKAVPGEVWLSSVQLRATGAAQGTGQAAAGQKSGSVPSLLQGNLQRIGQLTDSVLPQAPSQEGSSTTAPAPSNPEAQGAGQQGQAGGQARTGDNAAIPPVPDTLTLEGNSTSLAAVGVLVYQLGRLPHFSQVYLNEIKFDESKGITTFSVSARLKGGSGN